MGCHFLLQGIFLTQGSNLRLLHCRQILYPLSHRGSQALFTWDPGQCFTSLTSGGTQAFLVPQMVQNLPATAGGLQSLGQEDPLEKGMATYSSILTWRIPQTERPGGLQSMCSQRVKHDWAINTGGTQQWAVKVNRNSMPMWHTWIKTLDTTVQVGFHGWQYFIRVVTPRCWKN